MDANTHKEKLQKILQCHGIKNKTQLLKKLSEMLRSNPIGSIIENDDLSWKLTHEDACCTLYIPAKL